MPALPTAIDRVLLDKSDRRLDLLSGDEVVRSYETSLGLAATRTTLLPGQPGDWTKGCIAVTDAEIKDDIWSLVRDGTPIEIRP